MSPYACHLISLHRLVKAGYPFGQDDLDLDEWQDLGLVTETIEDCKEQLWQLRYKPIISGSRSAPKA